MDVLYHFPLNYTNSDSGVFKFNISIPGIGYYGQRTKRINEVEGWGTVITPFGTFQSLKVKSTLYVTDTIYYTGIGFGISFPRPVSYEYKWLANGKIIPVLQINAIGAGVTTVQYLDSIRPVAQVGIVENKANDILLSVFPNPVNDQLNINYSLVKSGVVKIELLDVLGQAVNTFVEQKQTEGSYSYRFDTSTINGKGFYFLRTAVNGKVLVRKIIIE